MITETKQPTHSHQIIHTLINRHGKLETRVSTRCHGATDDEAQAVFDDHVRHAEHAWRKNRTWNGVPVRITAIVLIDAAENVIAEWTYTPESVVAA